MKQYVLFLMILSLISMSCSSSGDNVTKTDKELSTEKTTEAESLLMTGSTNEAILAFELAISLDSLNVSAYSGLGWSFIISSSLDDARLALEKGINIDNQSAEISSALAFIYNALGDTNSLLLSNQYIESLILIDANWVSSYGFDFSITDIYIVLAQNHFLLGNFSESLIAIQLVDSTFTADIATETGRTLLSGKIENYNSGITKK